MPPLGAGFSQRLKPGDETMTCGALLRNGRSPARKRKLNEKMLRSSEAEMPISPLGDKTRLALAKQAA